MKFILATAVGLTALPLLAGAALADSREQALADAREQEHHYVASMAAAVSAWARISSEQYPGYEKFADKAAAYDFDRALAEHKVLAGTAEDIRAQVGHIRERHGADVCLSLQFNPGHLPAERSARALELFATEVAPAFQDEPAPARAATPVG